MTAMYDQIQFKIDDLLGCAEHKQLRDLFREMSSDAKNHLHASHLYVYRLPLLDSSLQAHDPLEVDERKDPSLCTRLVRYDIAS